MIIDIFTHIFPEKFVRGLGKADLGSKVGSTNLADLSSRPHFTDPEISIRMMDKYKIDVQVLSLATHPRLYSPVPVRNDDALAICRLANDALAQVVEKHPDRFIGVAVVPMLSGQEALDELDRAINALGLKGLQMHTNIAGKPLDSEAFLPFYERMQKYDLPIWLHPIDSKFDSWASEYQLDRIFGWPFNSSLAMGRLVFGGVLERFPRLKVITHHSGAMIPFFAERIRGFHDEHLHEAGFKEVAKNAAAYFKMLYADTAVNGWSPAVKCAIDFFGIERILFGSDYPFGPEAGERWLKDTLTSIHEMKLSEYELELIMSENARRILKVR